MSTTRIQKVTVSGEEKDRELDLIGSTADVNIVIEADDELCKNCHEKVVHYPDSGLVHDRGNGKFCDLLTDEEADEDSPFAELENQGPGQYVNWVGASVLEDSVEVQISVGDGRGCLAMNLWQVTLEDGRVVTYLRLPSPSDSFPHAKLTATDDPGLFTVTM